MAAIATGLWLTVSLSGVTPETTLADLPVAGLLVVELKAVKTIEEVHFAVVRSYLRATGRKHGLILNFAKATLSVKRVIASLPPHQDFLVSRVP